MVTLSKEDKVECIRSNNSLHYAGSNPVPTTKQSLKKVSKRLGSYQNKTYLYMTGCFFVLEKKVKKSLNKVAKRFGSHYYFPYLYIN